MGDAEIERPPQDRSLGVERPLMAEVVPQPERHLGQVDAAAPAAAIVHQLIPVRRGNVSHGQESVTAPGDAHAQATSDLGFRLDLAQAFGQSDQLAPLHPVMFGSPPQDLHSYLTESAPLSGDL